MGLAAWGVNEWLESHTILFPRLMNFLSPVIIGGGIYYLLARWMKMSGLSWVLGKGRRENAG